jgi:hypothetical protein
MPRLILKTKNRGGKKKYICEACGKEIVSGQKYYKWSFRYGGGPGGQTQEKIDNLESFKDSLESAASDIESEEFDESEESEKEDWLNELRSRAEEALQEFSE